ncbi:hypothetical protein AAHE18_02G186700 [Arachis hypogaea]
MLCMLLMTCWMKSSPKLPLRRIQDHEFDKDLFVGKGEENKITELGALANLHKSRMFDKNGINSLKLKWSSDKDENIADSQVKRDILDELQPHSSLKELEIGTRFPDWLGHSSYHNITTLTLQVQCISSP